MKSEDEWKPAAGANAPAAGFLYDRRQSRAVVILRSQNIFSKQAVQNAIFCRINIEGLFRRNANRQRRRGNVNDL